MAYSTVIAALAAAKRATAGNTIFAEWGAAAQTDIEYLGLNALLRDGSTSATGLCTFGAGIDTTSIVRSGVSVMDNSRNITGVSFLISGTTVIDSSRNAISLAGLSADTTARKLIVDIANHRYKLFNTFSMGSLANGNRTVFTCTYTTSPITGTWAGTLVTVDWGADAAAVNAEVLHSMVHSGSASLVKVTTYNNSGSTMATGAIKAEITATQ